MKRLGFLNLRGIGGQIAALVVASIIAIHLILTATFLIHRPDQPDPPMDRGHAQLVASVQLLAAAQFRNWISKTFLRVPLSRRTKRMALTCAVCGTASAAATGSFRSRSKMIPTRSASRCRTAR